ncbi:tRNA:m(4)X modification enzyme TRM13 [Cichlidogyrus casuarinus]|uniref:tRNA:m(4)X modification enzyme TRM13 n=1 Tax=Cichlidogyrus casuarinus TaxID=1844966 RepID=A0ABD2Q6R6_9PLAT
MLFHQYETNNINISQEIHSKISLASLNQVPETEIAQIIAKLEKIAEKELFQLDLSTENTCHPFVQLVMNDSRHWAINGSSKVPSESEKMTLDPKRGSGRHIYQHGFLLSLLRASNLLSPDFDYIELGAGRGDLSHWINCTLKSDQNVVNPNRYLLVDFATVRHKCESRQTFTSNRLRIVSNLAHIDLAKVSFINESTSSGIVLVAKHLCGNATDFSLRAIKTLPTETLQNLKGVIIATCCHHRCTWDQSTGREYLQSKFQIDDRQFFIISRLSTWATCGFERSEEHQPSDEETSSDQYKTLSTQQKIRIGRICKRIIDWARCQFLRDQLTVDWHKVAAVPYIDSSFTLENICLLAHK